MAGRDAVDAAVRHMQAAADSVERTVRENTGIVAGMADVYALLGEEWFVALRRTADLRETRRRGGRLSAQRKRARRG